MADPELVKIVRQGSEAWNRWRKQQSDDIQIDLSNADLSKVDLRGIDLYEANLYNVDLSYTNLSGANLGRSNLNNVDLSNAFLIQTILHSASLIGTILSGADLSSADLHGACLHGANLSGTDLSGSILQDADLSGARIWGTVFAYLDLRQTKGLIELIHNAPSRVELYTVQLPQDSSILHFLRGAGVPDEWIDFYRAQMIHPIQYYSCFISYSHHNEDFANRLHADLQAQGVRCWFAEEDLKIGDHYHQRIDDAIRVQDKLIIVLSEEAMHSTWVEREVVAAREKEERQRREVLFPIRLDNAVMETDQAWAADVRRRWHIGDFTRWKDHDRYQTAFDRLLRDLKKADE